MRHHRSLCFGRDLHRRRHEVGYAWPQGMYNHIVGMVHVNMGHASHDALNTDRGGGVYIEGYIEGKRGCQLGIGGCCQVGMHVDRAADANTTCVSHMPPIASEPAMPGA